MEQWKLHPTLPGIWVSTIGNVKREINKSHPERGKPWHYFTPHVNMDKTGYAVLRVSIRRKNHTVARLVAQTFLGLERDQVVRHRNNNSQDNRVTNLDIGSQQENIADKAAHGTWQGGDRHPCAKYSDELISLIQSDLEVTGKKRGVAKSLALKYDIPVHVIHDVSYGRRKTFSQRLKEAKCGYLDATLERSEQ